MNQNNNQNQPAGVHKLPINQNSQSSTSYVTTQPRRIQDSQVVRYQPQKNNLYASTVVTSGIEVVAADVIEGITGIHQYTPTNPIREIGPLNHSNYPTSDEKACENLFNC